MRLLMIIVESRYKEKVAAALLQEKVAGWTEIPTVYGMGETGLRLGSRAFPQTSTILFSVVEGECIEALVRTIDVLCADCRKAMRLLVWDVEKML
jgi:hypothetical protein